MASTTTPIIDNQQTTIDPASAIETFQQRVQLTAASHAVAARRPLGESVEACLVAAASQSPQTRRAYAKAIFDFLGFLADTRGHLCDVAWLPFVTQGQEGRRTVYVYNEKTPSAVLWLVDAALLDAFALHLAETQQVSHSTVETRYNAVRTFLRVALRDNILTHEQGLQLGIRPYVQRRPRREQTVGRRLSVVEVRQLRGVVDVEATKKGLRDRAILDCMLFAGLRRAEVADIQMSHIQLDQGRYWLDIDGKGNKKRKLKVHDVLYKSLTAWQHEVGIEAYEERPLFVAVDKWDYIKGTQIDPNVIERITAEYAAKAGLAPKTGKYKLSPHDLRRTCAKNAYNNGAALLQVQKMLGHSDPKTTAKYIGLDQDDNQTAIDCVKVLNDLLPDVWSICMFESLWANKEWLFSGIGVAIVAAIISVIWRRGREKSQKGDVIYAEVEENTRNVAVGKGIIQIGKLKLPKFLIFIFLVIALLTISYFSIQAILLYEPAVNSGCQIGAIPV